MSTAEESGYQVLELDARVVAGAHNLPSYTNHKDPFDRLLIWECIRLDMTMLTALDSSTERVYRGAWCDGTPSNLHFLVYYLP